MASDFLKGGSRIIFRGRKKQVQKFTKHQGLLILAGCAVAVTTFLILLLLGILRGD
jgi:hypothetical protein